MTGTKVPMTGRGVDWPRISFDKTTLKTGSRVLTVCVRLMATAAKDRLAATCPMACMEAGPAIVWNSDLVIGYRQPTAVVVQQRKALNVRTDRQAARRQSILKYAAADMQAVNQKGFGSL